MAVKSALLLRSLLCCLLHISFFAAVFVVVGFMDGHEVETVPASWVDDAEQEISWPPYTISKITIAVKNLDPPPPSWTVFPIKRVFCKVGEC